MHSQCGIMSEGKRQQTKLLQKEMGVERGDWSVETAGAFRNRVLCRVPFVFLVANCRLRSIK
jgi:hypothetical protein